MLCAAGTTSIRHDTAHRRTSRYSVCQHQHWLAVWCEIDAAAAAIKLALVGSVDTSHRIGTSAWLSHMANVMEILGVYFGELGLDVLRGLGSKRMAMTSAAAARCRRLRFSNFFLLTSLMQMGAS